MARGPLVHGSDGLPGQRNRRNSGPENHQTREPWDQCKRDLAVVSGYAIDLHPLDPGRRKSPGHLHDRPNLPVASATPPTLPNFLKNAVFPKGLGALVGSVGFAGNAHELAKSYRFESPTVGFSWPSLFH